MKALHAFLRIAFNKEKKHYLRSKDERLFPADLSDHDKELRAEKLAEEKIWQNIKDNMGTKKQ